MSATPPARSWIFHRFGILVTGRGEEEFLPFFMRSLASEGDCTFQVIGRIAQRSPITSEKKVLRMTGSGKAIPDRDVAEIGLPARNYLNKFPNSFLLLMDDLEHNRRDKHQQIFERYRAAFDEILPESSRRRASVHFLVNMMEAYYFSQNALQMVLARQTGGVF